jgi:hypothetical protein
MVPRLHERLLDQILNLLDRGDVVRDLGDDNARQAFWFGLIQFLMAMRILAGSKGTFSPVRLITYRMRIAPKYY